MTIRPKAGRHMYGWKDRGHVVGVAVTATSDRGVVPVHGSLAVYPGTFDPFTPGHLDLLARARVMFDQIIVLLAVNADKRPTAEATTRAVQVREALPAPRRLPALTLIVVPCSSMCAPRRASPR